MSSITHKAQPSLGYPKVGRRCCSTKPKVWTESPPGPSRASGGSRRAGDKQAVSPENCHQEAPTTPLNRYCTVTFRRLTQAKQGRGCSLQWGGQVPGKVQGKLAVIGGRGQCGHWGKSLYDVQHVSAGRWPVHKHWFKSQTSSGQMRLGLWWGRRGDWHASKEMNTSCGKCLERSQ